MAQSDLGDLYGGFLREAEARFAERPAASVSGGFETFVDYIERVRPDFRWYYHTRLLAKVLQSVADGELKRLMIWIPPGCGKSEEVSRLFTAYYLTRYPMREVGLVSYGASLAEDLAGDAREYFIAGGGRLDPSTAAKGDWGTASGGGMWGKGFAGPVRGRRFHLGIIDDPHKGPEELDSPILVTKFQRWYQRTWLNRQNLFDSSGAAIVVVMQRLACNDLCGFLLDQPDGDQWTIVALDAVRSDEPFAVPDASKVYPDERQVGDLLCPEILSEARLAEQRIGDDASADAQYQQRPKQTASTVFERAWFANRCLPEQVPLCLYRVMGVDLAVSTKQMADYTVGFPLAYGVNGKYYLFNPYREHSSAPVSETAIAVKARAMRVQRIGVETVAFQLSFVQHLRERPELAGIHIQEVRVDRDKVARAKGWRSFARDGLIILVDDGTGWIDVFVNEIERFPRGKHDDQVDAVGIAFEALREIVSHSAGTLVGGKRDVALTNR